MGASANAPRAGIFERRRLGLTEESLVYVAELKGIEMPLWKFIEQQNQTCDLRHDPDSDEVTANWDSILPVKNATAQRRAEGRGGYRPASL